SVGRASGAIGEAAASSAGWCWGASSDLTAPQSVGRASGAIGMIPNESAGWCWDWVPV
ncbi:MAG: hypothetical protein JWR90_3418, partial [Marmoricola sp.]|nr:hypothetical protein [Marmoricola sp.]